MIWCPTHGSWEHISQCTEFRANSLVPGVILLLCPAVTDAWHQLSSEDGMDTIDTVRNYLLVAIGGGDSLFPVTRFCPVVWVMATGGMRLCSALNKQSCYRRTNWIGMRLICGKNSSRVRGETSRVNIHKWSCVKKNLGQKSWKYYLYYRSTSWASQKAKVKLSQLISHSLRRIEPSSAHLFHRLLRGKLSYTFSIISPVKGFLVDQTSGPSNSVTDGDISILNSL